MIKNRRVLMGHAGSALIFVSLNEAIRL